MFPSQLTKNGSSGAYVLRVSGSTANLDHTPPTVSSSLLNGNPAEGVIVAPGDITYTATFSEELASAGLGAEDVVLTNMDTGVAQPLATDGFQYDPVTSLLTLNYAGLAEGNYRLTLVSDAQGFRDTQDNPLDGRRCNLLPRQRRWYSTRPPAATCSALPTATTPPSRSMRARGPACA